MSELRTVPTGLIRPSQDFVKERTVGYILHCLSTDDTEKLPPTPIVRTSPDGLGYIAIDGHNLIVIHDLLGTPIEVLIARSAIDGFTTNDTDPAGAIVARNQDLAEKYDTVLEEVTRLQDLGVTSFADLRARYPYLISYDVALKHFGLTV